MHTLGFRELLDLLAFVCAQEPDAEQPTLHVLLRYDPGPLAAVIGTYRPYFDRIRTSPTLARSVRFHADTERLAATFSHLTGVAFLHAPIPFDQAHLRAALTDAAPRVDDALRVLYLGDARLEKGYTDLPAAVASLWTDLVGPGRIRFVIQSNFNTPGGEPGVLSAQQQLAAYGDRRVRLLPEALDAPAYYRHLAEADIALIPYDAGRYRERSSGVLVEAMAAGLPVVTSAGSWMETQVGPDNAVLFDAPDALADALRRAVAEYPRLRAGAQVRQAAVLESASPGNFIRHIVAATPEPAAGERPSVLLVMNGDAMVLRNGSSRIARSQLQYLAAAGYAVTGLFLSHRRLDGAAYRAWHGALLGVLHDFAFERVFVATPGCAPGDAPNTGTPTLADEFVAASAYAVPASLAGALRTTPPDLILLNYITALPLVDALGIDAPIVCEMHDLQAVQRAIYARRPVDPDELALETRHLARCQHVVSLNPRETAFVRDTLPSVPVTTIGVQIAASPARLADLAGLRDLADVIAACGPQRPALRPARRPASERVALFDASGIDVLFVSSAHLSNVSGLRWFLDTVRARHLPDLRVVVAGSICDLGPWPDEPGLHFVGQLDDLAPLYAAARIVILPIREGAGSAVKTYEALAYGKPIVATSLAFRGLDGAEAMVAHDEPEDFAAAIEALLAAPDLRASHAAAARAAALRLGDVGRYRAALNGVLGAVLGPRARPAPAPEPTRAGADLVEWSPLLGTVNRLCRAVIAGYPPDPLLRVELSGFDPATTLALVETVARTILEERPVSLLKSDDAVASEIVRFAMREPVDTVVAAARIVLGSPASEAAHRVLFDGRSPIRISNPGAGAGRARVQAGRSVLGAKSSPQGGLVWTYRPDPAAHPHLGLCLEPPGDAPWAAVQTLSAAEREAAVLALPGAEGIAITLLPPICATGTAWVEVGLPERDAAEAALRLDDGAVPTIRLRAGGRLRLRAAIPPAHRGGPFTPLTIRLHGVSDPALVRDIGVGWSSQALEDFLAGDPHVPALPAEVAPAAGGSGLSRLFSGALRQALRPRTVRPLCVAPELSLVIAVDPSPGADKTPLRCFADGVELVRTGAADRVAFLRPGSVEPRSWCPRIQLVGAGADPHSGTVTLTLDGLRDAVTGDRGFIRTNLHEPEYIEGRISHRWSGADPVTVIDVPVWSDRPGRLEVVLVALGRNTDPDDVAVAIDGAAASIERADRDGVVTITAAIPPRSEAGSTRVEVAVRTSFHPEGDTRTLGVAFGSVRFVYPFSAAVDRLP
ncbi:glycosyltransferase [Methylobacterium sp. NMS12]|uniref:glycosyltransferase n=1 Tax=Methylobacterium sp. NMS12 TaxID=3079766 RepID=UPI003F885D3D